MRLVVTAVNNNCVMVLLGWAWVSPTLAELHYNTCVYVCLCFLAYVRPFTKTLNWTNGYEGTHTFQICTHAICVQCKYLTLCWWIYWMQQKTPHRVTQHQSIEYERQIVSGARGKGYCWTAASMPKRRGAEKLTCNKWWPLCFWDLLHACRACPSCM